MQVVADLFPLVPENPVGSALQVALDQVAEKAVEFDAVMGKLVSDARRRSRFQDVSP